MILLIFILGFLGVFLGLNSLILRRINQLNLLYRNMENNLHKQSDVIGDFLQLAKPQMMVQNADLLHQANNYRWKFRARNKATNEKVKAYNNLHSIFLKVQSKNITQGETLKGLQSEWHNLVAEIEPQQKMYNRTVAIYNDAIMWFPANFIAKLLNYSPKTSFEGLSDYNIQL
ncbi:MAG: LemA family protein [Chitinophagales bacterium]